MEPVPVEGVVVEGVSALTCFNCSLNLTGHRYILRDDKPFCIQCYEQLFANRCEECKQAIGTDFKVRLFLIQHWWRFSLVVTRWSRSTSLLYAGPG